MEDLRMELYCPQPGLQSAKPNASVSGKLAILLQRHYVNAISMTASMGYSISVARAMKTVQIFQADGLRRLQHQRGKAVLEV
jgi:hypothetical protein